MAANSGYDVLPLHPLIEGLAVGLEDPARQNLSGAKAAAARAAQQAAPAWAPLPRGLTAASEVALTKFPGPRRPEVVMFAGYLGPGTHDPGEDRTWRFLYQDAKAMTWLLVSLDDIVLHERVKDRKAAFRLRDVIWVKADAPVRQGSEAESAAARFLVGTFTNAGDLHGTLTAANPSPPDSGILCVPTPACCCTITRTHR